MATHLALPLAVTTSGALAALEQDSPLEVAQSVALLLDTRPGERLADPDYGALDMIAVGIDADTIAAAIDEHEPRADPSTIEQLTLRGGVEEHAIVRLDQTAETTGEEQA